MVPSAANPPGFALGLPVASTGGGGVERICPNRPDRKIDEVPPSYFVDPAVHISVRAVRALLDSPLESRRALYV